MPAQLAELEHALETRTVIGRAVGMLMERYGLDDAAALNWLEEAAAAERTSTYKVAARLTSTRQLGTDPKADAARTFAMAGALHPGQDSLSNREVQVMRLVASGASNMEIAETLFLGINTVKTYVRTAYRKAGVSRRALAVIWVREGGLNAYTTVPTTPTTPTAPSTPAASCVPSSTSS